MEITLSLKEAVYLKGNESQINAFNELGNLKGNSFASLLKKYEEEYKKVEVIGRGAKRELILADKRSFPINLDGRHQNTQSGKKTKFASQLELLIIKALRDSKNKSIEGSIGSVMHKMKMANKSICYHRQPNRLKKHVMNLEGNEISVSKDFLVHVLDKEHEVLTGALLTALENLRKKKYLRWSKYPVGFYNNSFFNLNHQEASQLAEIERNLKGKHNVTTYQILTYPFSNPVKSYEKELKKHYRGLGVEYYFEAFSIRLVASEKEVDETLANNEMYIEKDFIVKYLKHALDKAQKRQDKYKDRLLGFGLFDPVKEKLAEGTYVNEYESTMKHSVLPDN